MNVKKCFGWRKKDFYAKIILPELWVTMVEPTVWVKLISPCLIGASIRLIVARPPAGRKRKKGEGYTFTQGYKEPSLKFTMAQEWEKVKCDSHNISVWHENKKITHLHKKRIHQLNHLFLWRIYQVFPQTLQESIKGHLKS